MATFTWSPDSTVQIDASSSVHPIHRDLPGIRGEARADVRDGALDVGPSASGYIEADVDALRSGNRLEDFELRRRLDAKKFPTMRYEVRGVDGGPGTFKVTGALTFHGVTREFVEECAARIEGGALHVDAEHTFDIRDFDVKPPKLGPLQVRPEVKITLHLVGRESAGSSWG